MHSPLGVIMQKINYLRIFPFKLPGPGVANTGAFYHNIDINIL